MLGKRISWIAASASALLYMTSGVRAGDDPEPACNDADIEDLDTSIQCNGGNWRFFGNYDVEIEDPASGSEYDLVLTVVDCNHIPADSCGQLATYTIPLNNPTPLDDDDDDEIEYEGTFSQCLASSAIHCNRLRVRAQVVERCGRAVYDEEEDRVDVIEPGTCTAVAVSEPCAPCDPCAETRTVSTVSDCDPCARSSVTTVRYEDSSHRRTYITDNDADDVEIEVDD